VQTHDTSWMMTADAFKGFKPIAGSSGQPRFWLCVSKENKFDPHKRYDPPEGYEWALSAMWCAANVTPSPHLNYHGQGGWNQYSFGGIVRECFIFQDTTTTTRFVHAGDYPRSEPKGFGSGDYTVFGGIVVIKKGTWDSDRNQFKQ